MFLGGWTMMIVVAMVPATLPTARLVGVARGAQASAAFLLAYGAVWLAIGFVGYVVLSPLAPAMRWVGGAAALTAAAFYELSPVKDACLRRCRAPLRILLQPSAVGGLQHGVDCAGCCAFLMALMIVLGLMSVVWMVVLALVVLVQKAAPFGERSPAVLAFFLGTAAVVAWAN